jgi:thiosulfate/3-mercaptopyruvate sulfurtransferase
MIETYFNSGLLDSVPAYFAALILGISFGWCLEQAGLSSSKRLTGVFYFRNMTVVKVLLTAIVTALLGFAVLVGTGFVEVESVYMPETWSGAQIFAGVLFGIGLVVGGWCPTTAAVGTASGKIDALIFLVGAVLGSIVFNETYGFFEEWHKIGIGGVNLIYSAIGISAGQFALIFCGFGIFIFWLSELIERRFDFAKTAAENSALWVVSIAMLIAATGVNVLHSERFVQKPFSSVNFSKVIARMKNGNDLIEPIDLAREMVKGESRIICVDLRSSDEYFNWHIPGARNFSPDSLARALSKYKKHDKIILYSNDSVFAAKICVVLALQGYNNCYVLSGGIKKLFETVLKPAALRISPLTEQEKAEIAEWRSFFLQSQQAVSSQIYDG